jgi:hypothetical protein
MSKYLITPSLLNSFAYYIQDEWKSPAESRADFLKTLSRKKFEPNEAMQKGIDFEDDIENYCNNKFRPTFKKQAIGAVFSWDEISKLGYDDCENPSGFCCICDNDDCEGECDISRETHEEPLRVKDDYSECVIACGKIVKDGLWQQSVKKEIKVGNQEFLLYGRTDVIKRDTIYDIKFTGNYELGKFLDSSQHLIYLYCSDLPNFSYLISDGKEFWREDYHNHAGIENEIKSKISDFLGYLENDKEAKEMFLTKWESKNNNNAR